MPTIPVERGWTKAPGKGSKNYQAAAYAAESDSSYQTNRWAAPPPPERKEGNCNGPTDQDGRAPHLDDRRDDRARRQPHRRAARRPPRHLRRRQDAAADAVPAGRAARPVEPRDLGRGL